MWRRSSKRVRNESVNDFSISMFVVVLLNYVYFSHLLFKYTKKKIREGLEDETKRKIPEFEHISL